MPFSLADSTHCLEALLAGGCKDVQTLIRSEAPESRDWIIHDAELPAFEHLDFSKAFNLWRLYPIDTFCWIQSTDVNSFWVIACPTQLRWRTKATKASRKDIEISHESGSKSVPKNYIL